MLKSCLSPAQILLPFPWNRYLSQHCCHCSLWLKNLLWWHLGWGTDCFHGNFLLYAPAHTDWHSHLCFACLAWGPASSASLFPEPGQEATLKGISQAACQTACLSWKLTLGWRLSLWALVPLSNSYCGSHFLFWSQYFDLTRPSRRAGFPFHPTKDTDGYRLIPFFDHWGFYESCSSPGLFIPRSRISLPAFRASSEINFSALTSEVLQSTASASTPALRCSCNLEQKPTNPKPQCGNPE